MTSKPASKKTNSTESQSTEDSHINILKEACCPTSSGKSTLGYQIGADEKGDVQFKITSNSGGGHFTSSWIALKDVQAALKDWPQDQAITSMALRPLSRGKSANDAGFACAVLVAEGFLIKVAGKSRLHEAIDPKLFKSKIAALQAGGGMPAKKATKTPARRPKTKAATKAKARTARKAPATKRKAK